MLCLNGYMDMDGSILSMDRVHCWLYHAQVSTQHCHLPVLDFLATSLLHLGLSLACLRLGDTCGILVATPHACVGAPGGVGAVGGDDGP